MKWFLTLLVMVLPLSACNAQTSVCGEQADMQSETQGEVQRLALEVVAIYPHDTGAYTQGLLLCNGKLFESTGLYGDSTLRAVDIETGEVVRQIELEDSYFGEGLARVGDKLIQLTWQENVAFVYDLATFEQLATFEYEGEGWGLCYDGEVLYMSNGSDTLTLRDPETFEVLDTVAVKLNGEPVNLLNELECAKGNIYANIYTLPFIFRIAPDSGKVTAVINATGLLSEAERKALESDEVLNGIAYNPEADTFYLTGKNWPRLFEVRFEAVSD